MNTHGERWRLVLLGEARLLRGDEVTRLDRKEAALLAWLALEGPTSRQVLAELLWPGSAEKARANMRQLLRRLKLSAGGELVAGSEALALAQHVPADAAELPALVSAGRFAQALALEGELLATFLYADLPDFHDWLTRTRERLAGLRRRATAAEIDRLEAEGQLARALALAERLLAAEPTSEETYRRLMRLHYLSGDRSAALGLYAQCRRMLQHELDAEPLSETVALAQDIERGRALPRPVPATRSVLPASVLRPPVLAGRERAWAQLEAAWNAGQLIYLAGPPGMGKSRLAHDFASSKGASRELGCRPGDIHVPYATLRRNFQKMLAYRPDVQLEPWIRREVARVLPQAGEAPPPMASEADRLRFCEAAKEVLGRCTAGLEVLVVDDFQFADAATVSISEYIFSSFFPLGGEGAPRVIACFRAGELSPEVMSVIHRLMDAGMAAVIELEPLSAEAVGRMLEGMALPGASRLVADLARYTAGNPLYLTETVKHLLETGGLERGWPGRLPPPGKVGPLIQRRLERLSRPALRLAQVAALAKTDFTLELAAEVLALGPLDLDVLLTELEVAQIFKGEAFTHDLVFEAVLGAIPEALRPLLHQRLAEALERRQAAPAVVAHHWQEGGHPRRAVPFLLEAAHAAEATLQRADAASLRQRAATLQAS